MIRRPPRSTLDRSSAASDVYKRQNEAGVGISYARREFAERAGRAGVAVGAEQHFTGPVSYTHLRAHETVLDLVCRLLLEKKKYYTTVSNISNIYLTDIKLTHA